MAIKNSVIIDKIKEISKQRNSGHVGSCLTAAPILNAIYNYRNSNDIVVLSSGHAGLALYCVLKEHGYLKDIDSKGTHPDYSPSEGIDASTGSLGHGIGISVGYALADRSRYVYCVSSDGEIAEGSFWESLDVAVNLKLSNLKVYINCNGYSAYREVDIQSIISKVIGFGCAALVIDNVDQEIIDSLGETVADIPLVVIVKSNSDFDNVKGLEAHYLPIQNDN